MNSQNHAPRVYRVSELTHEIQDALEKRFDFVWVEGEVSNFSAPASGHLYMVIKDDKAQIRGVMFRLKARYLRFVPENGMHVLVQGRIGVYPPRGEYQIIMDYLEPMGVGALALAFEQLKKKLAGQGVFDQEIKKPLPFLPQRVAVITSPSGAAIRDFLKVIQRRFINMEIIIVPVRVQGEEAAGDIIKALDLVNSRLNADVIVVTRGGGSLEDLWAFNEETLALAIRRSKIPVVSAVGHEIDMTICDMAADFRAPTPSAAAELLVEEKEKLLERLKEKEYRLLRRFRDELRYYSDVLKNLNMRLKDPRKGMHEAWLLLDELYDRMIRTIHMGLRERKHHINAVARTLAGYSPRYRIQGMEQTLTYHRHAGTRAMVMRINDLKGSLLALEKRINDLSPLSVLKRGYSITRKLPEMNVLKNAMDTRYGDRVQVLLAEGELICRVEDRRT